MTRKSPLRAVTADDPAPTPTPKSLKDAADRGERELLVMMRDEISDTIAAKPPAHTLAPLMRQLREIDREIRAFDMRSEDQKRAEVDRGAVGDSFDASAV